MYQQCPKDQQKPGVAGGEGGKSDVQDRWTDESSLEENIVCTC